MAWPVCWNGRRTKYTSGRMPELRNCEIEIKLRVRSLEELFARLRKVRARGERRVFEENTLYDTPGRGLFEQGKMLRLRVETPVGGVASERPRRPPAAAVRGGKGVGWRRSRRALLTFKGRRGGDGRYKVREEIETGVDDPAGLARVLQSIGFAPIFRYEKFRSLYCLPGMAGGVVALDETPAGLFLEVEGSMEAIDQVATRLGFTASDYLTVSYWDLHEEHCRFRGVHVRDMQFGIKKVF
jgi:adenylate cyclase class 2